MLGVGGFLSIVLGVLSIVQPAAGGLVVTLMIGAYALVFGIALVAPGTRLRQWNVVGGERNTLRPTRS